MTKVKAKDIQKLRVNEGDYINGIYVRKIYNWERQTVAGQAYGVKRYVYDVLINNTHKTYYTPGQVAKVINHYNNNR